MSKNIGKIQYNYRAKENIEKCIENKFVIYTLEKNNEIIEYVEYGNNFYKAKFIKDTKSVIVDSWIMFEEQEKIKNTAKIDIYEFDEIIKQYSGMKFDSFSYVKQHKFTVQNAAGKEYYNPEIIISNSEAIIKINDEVITTVRDIRNISLLGSINKSKDFVYITGNTLFINSFKLIDREDDEFEITIYGDDNKYNKALERCIKSGCIINNEIWMFFVEDKTSTVKGTMLLKLPDGNYYNVVLEGKQLKIKSRDKRRNLRGQAIALVRKKENIVVKFKKGDLENEAIDERLRFNHITSGYLQNSRFMEMMKEYKEIESIMLEQAKKECQPLRYEKIEKNRFIISEKDREKLGPWMQKKGVNIKVGEKSIGIVDEIGDYYVKVSFTDDLVRSCIGQKNGKLEINMRGDEVIRERRENAISILENNSSANSNLAEILSGEKILESYRVLNKIPKSDIGNLKLKQIEAVEGVLNVPDIYLIQGPPGAGKTTVIRKIVDKILKEEKQVLITSYQNLAVDNVLDGFLKEDIIPYRFGDTQNNVMDRICDEIVSEININLKENISLDREKELEQIRISISELRQNVYAAGENSILLYANSALDLIKEYEGESSYYYKMHEMAKELESYNAKEQKVFSRDEIIDMFPKTYGCDFEVAVKLEKVEAELMKINKDINSKTISDTCEKIKYLNDFDTLSSLQDSEYQKIKAKIYDDLKLVKVGQTADEFDLFEYQLRIATVLDELIDNMPEFIENKKYSIVKNFHDKISKNPLLIQEVLYKFPDLRGTTCQKTASNVFLETTKGIDYDYVIVDEAARANPLDLIIPLVKGKKVILVGDHMQLPHMIEDYVESKFKESDIPEYGEYEEFIEQSLFGRLFKQLPDNRKTMLDTQYRMTKEIGDLVSDLFYESKLETGTNIINDTPLYTGNALVFVDIKGKQRRNNAGSLINKIEADSIIEQIKELERISEIKNETKITVGIISFYKAQVDYLRQNIKSLGLEKIQVDVGTVDAYQGLEKDIIFISAVRTQGMGFVSNPNRINVALSRAKKLVVIFGDKRNLQSDELFNKIIDRCIDGRSI